MKIQIKQPVSLHEKGEKDLNEDFIFPLSGQANIEEKLFIVCDGEGGANAGDVASKLVALSFAKYFASTPHGDDLTKEFLEKALRTAEEALTAYKEAHKESEEMATTLALLYLGKTKITMAWVGNSRIAYFDSKNDVLITSSADTSKNKKNIQGNNQPADIETKSIPVKEIHPGDYFFLATDGIEEQVDNSVLESIFRGDNNPEPPKLIEEINKLSHGFSQDNYSCYLIQVAEVDKGVSTPSDSQKAAETAAGAVPPTEEEPRSEHIIKEEDNSVLLKNLAFGALLVLVLCLVFVAWRYSSNKGSDFNHLVERGDRSMEARNYQLAFNQYDSAYQVATKEVDKEIAARQKKEALRLLNTPNIGIVLDAEPIDSLKQTAEAYKDEADEFFRLGNYEEALKSYTRSERVREFNGEKLPEIPQDNIAKSYIHLANKLFESPEKDCNQVVALYTRAFDIYQSDEVSPSDENLLSEAKTKAEECKTILAEGTTDTEEKELKPAIADASTAETREEPKNTDSGKTTSESVTRSVTPATSAGATSSSDPTIRRTAINTRSLSTEQTAEMEKYISTGKRLFVKARDSGSSYEYRLSAQNLEQASQMLDGPAAYMLAYMYNLGLGVEKDEAKALKYAQVSAIHEWPAGHYLYAHLLLEREYPRDSVTARQSLIKASNQNFLKAIERLAELDQ